MVFDGNYSFFVNGESKTKEEVKDLLHSNMTVSISGLNVSFISPKKGVESDINKRLKFAEEIRNSALKNYNLEMPVLELARVYNTENEEDLKTLEFLGFSAPKKNKNSKASSVEELLEEVDKHQEQNGGRDVNMEFPFDAVLTPTREIAEKIEKYITIDNILDFQYNLEKVKMKEFLENYAEKTKSDREQEVIEDWNKAYDFKLPVYSTIGTPDDMKNKETQDNGSMGFNFQKSQIDKKENKIEGVKETDGKVDYSEINFKLLDLMAKRFMDNKHKYPKGNTLKVIDKDEILWAAFRHIRKMIQPIENDLETYEDHLSAVATNMSIILDQLYKK